MKLGNSVVAIAVGVVFGAATSLINDVSSPYGMIGNQMGDTVWRWAAEVASKLLDAGWAWAGLAIAVGWLAGSTARGAIAGSLSLLAATAAYFGMDSILWNEPGIDVGLLDRLSFLYLYWPDFWPEIRFWWLASVVLGPVLGVVGASIKRPGVIGLLAGLTLPVGATVQMIWLTGNPPPEVSPEPAMDWARAIVWVATAVGAGVIIARFGARLRPSSRTRSEQK